MPERYRPCFLLGRSPGPEYPAQVESLARSVPGVLKNAIDVGSRPYGQSVWSGKPCGVISVSPGAIGAFGANQHIRQSCVFLDMPAMQQPEAYIGNAASLFDADGKLLNDGTRQLLEKFITRFEKWVEIHS